MWSNINIRRKQKRKADTSFLDSELEKYISIDFLYEFAGISPKELKLVELEEVTFYVPSLRQFLSIYEASSKDSYRNDQNNHKDFAKIEWLKKTIK